MVMTKSSVLLHRKTFLREWFDGNFCSVLYNYFIESEEWMPFRFQIIYVVPLKGNQTFNDISLCFFYKYTYIGDILLRSTLNKFPTLNMSIRCVKWNLSNNFEYSFKLFIIIINYNLYIAFCTHFTMSINST